MTKYFSFLIFLFIIADGYAQATFDNTLKFDSTEMVQAIDIQELKWIAGSWYGEAFGAKTEEVWNDASGGSMIGMFKLYNDEGVIFYELMSIQQEGESLMLRIKHFDVNLHGWEEKEETVDFRFIKATEGKAYFDGLTFELVSQEELNVYVVISHEDGTSTEEKFPYQRVHSN